MKENWPREKNWKHVYTRSEKRHRARQLGFEYPHESEENLAKSETINVLFVCSMNQWRSPTAESIYSKRPFVNARSRGTSRSARRTVTAEDLKWADIVFVMEDKHKQRLQSEYPSEVRYKELHVLDIPDNYKFMDPELIIEITESVDPILAR
ncbi:MAG: low molecular weight protein tyrosine phosphatase family protein [Pirellula sp.]